MEKFIIDKKEIQILENPNYIHWKSISNLLPYNLKEWIKDYKFFLPIELIKWLLVDKTRPRFFHPYGFNFYTGLPGTGKTIAMTNELQNYRNKYGNEIYIATNYGFKNEDFAIHSYEDVIKIYDKPTIIGYDEIQNDFDSRNWANLDYAFSERITQSRKLNGLMILATAQRFGFVDKRLRQLTHKVLECKTFFNRLTISRIYEPEIKEKIEEGQYIDFNKQVSRGVKMFVQSDELRSLYSSYDILLKVQEKLQRYQKTDMEQLKEIREFLTKPAI